MATITDPATELSDVASNLLDSTNTKGGAYLAEKFEVEPWSAEFYKIVACILERADLVYDIVVASDMKPINRDKAAEEITAFKNGFAGSALFNVWNHGNGGLPAMRDHGARLGFLEKTVRQVVSYPELEEHERKEMIALINVYMEELQDSDEGPAFVRQAIMDVNRTGFPGGCLV
ncbi:hypothetical protein [Blastomonas sp.]|uniref:hypothetical protein n=1 Tax=Blastomonas sp. TaxID=1909299 RepID=UPI00261D9015|nr:hypothetical protein [Blastomonas sp.]MDM7954751.1 hypothetical protein [Blastomonas sp.]